MAQHICFHLKYAYYSVLYDNINLLFENSTVDDFLQSVQ